MASWPKEPRYLGKELTRVDGLAKASGRAKYPSDERPAGLLYGVLLSSPHAHAKIKVLDLAPAEKSPGVKAVLALAESGATLRFQGDLIAAVAAETEDQARDAVKAIKVEYEVLPHAVTEPQAMAEGAPTVVRGGNVRKGRAQTRGEPDQALADAAATIEGTYSAPVITHVCLEPHGLTAKWEGDDKIVAWASTQSVTATAQELAQRFNIPVNNVTVLTEVMGGGFGSKFGADAWGVAAAELSKKSGRPVRMFLDRAQEHQIAGNRPSAAGTLKLGADKDGKLTVLVAETHGTSGVGGSAGFPLPYVYDVPNLRRAHSDVFVNAGQARAMRAPGHPQGCNLMEAAVDDLADKLGIDPLEMRLKSLAEQDMVSDADGKPTVNRSAIYREQVKLGAEAIGWANRKARGQSGDGPIKRGYGMALHQWGGGGQNDKQATVIINPDGTVEVRSATQDIGTGARTIMAMVVAEVLGVDLADVKGNIGNSNFVPGQASGGSTTTPSMAPAAYNAADQARVEFLKRIAPSLGAAVEDLELKGGVVLVKGEREVPFKEACRKLGMMPINVTAGIAEGLKANGVGGCQFAEVTVDVETGVVTVNKIVAVQDSGLILNLMTWRSQVYGGIIGGLNYGLFEERVMDPATGVMLNPDMELYKLAGASDVPEIVVIPFDTPEMRARGVIGIGEPPTISTAVAIANAVTNAVGVRVPNWPMSPMNVLNALAAEA